MELNEINNDNLIKAMDEFLQTKEINNMLEEMKKATFITPIYYEGENVAFLAMGSNEKEGFRIPVFSNKKEHEKIINELKLREVGKEYEAFTTPIDLFVNLANNDDVFEGIILDIHGGNYIIARDILLLLLDQVEKVSCNMG